MALGNSGFRERWLLGLGLYSFQPVCLKFSPVSEQVGRRAGGDSGGNDKLPMEVSDTPLRPMRSHSGHSTFVNRVSVFYQRNINFFLPLH